MTVNVLSFEYLRGKTVTGFQIFQRFSDSVNGGNGGVEVSRN